MAHDRAIVLLSGGMDSAVALAMCQNEGRTPYALTIDYGQRHRIEIDAARRVAKAMDVRQHIVLSVDLTQWGGSALTGDHDVPTGRAVDEMGLDIPITYVPARNTIFLSLATAWAETLGTPHVYIGAHTLDYSGYPDCRAEYFRAFEQMANLATKTGVEGTSRLTIQAPLVGMSKTDIVEEGHRRGVPFELTNSCYQPSDDALACGRCDACTLRRQAFESTGVADPTRYVAEFRRS